jgi:hypothetical protein
MACEVIEHTSRLRIAGVAGVIVSAIYERTRRSGCIPAEPYPLGSQRKTIARPVRDESREKYYLRAREKLLPMSRDLQISDRRTTVLSRYSQTDGWIDE